MSLRNLNKRYKVVNSNNGNVLGHYTNLDLAKNKLHNISKNLKINCHLIDIKLDEVISKKEA